MQPVIPVEPNLADVLKSIGIATAEFGGNPCAVVSVTRTIDGHSCVEAWLLDPRMNDAFDARCRREAAILADGTSSVGETIVLFAMTQGGEPAVAQIAHGMLKR